MTSIQILDGPRFESNLKVDLDTSLDQALQKHPQGTSDFSSPSNSSDLLSPDRSTCRHTKLLNQDNYNTCVSCGVYVPKNGTKSYKSASMNYSALFPPKTIYETMTKRSYSFKSSSNPQYIKNRPTYVKNIIQLAEELKISMNSAHLGIFLLDAVMFSDPLLGSRIQLYAPICLLVAAKTIELDARIPFLPKLKRQASSAFSVDEFRKAELRVLDIVDWNAQFSTALEIVEFLMCQGVLFSTDEIEDSNKSSPKVLTDLTLNEKNQAKGLKSGEKPWSPVAKLNRENSSVSDASTNGASPGDLPNIYQRVQSTKEDSSPRYDTTTILKRKKRNLTMDLTPSASKEKKVFVEKKAGKILASFEFLYQALLTKMVGDVEFIKYEPKVVAAATVTFLRGFNKISTVWNNELESITQLKFSQVSECYEYIKKNYTDLCTSKTAKNRGLVCDTNNIKVSELVLGSRTSSGEENQRPSYFPNSTKVGPITTGTSGYNRPTITTNNNLSRVITVPNPNNAYDKKPVFNYPATRDYTTTSSNVNPSTATYSYLREDTYYSKIKPNSGTLNTETQRNPLNKRIFATNSGSSNKYGLPAQDNLGPYYAQIRSNLPEPISADTVGSYLNRKPNPLQRDSNLIFKNYRKF